MQVSRRMVTNVTYLSLYRVFPEMQAWVMAMTGFGAINVFCLLTIEIKKGIMAEA